MARYKRYRKRSTNVVRMKFQSFMDISTNDTSMQVITVSAGGKEILKRLAPQFSAYKYYKIGNIAVKLVPASTLPVDPTGLSYESGEPGVDPRDQLTPGMMRITNGEDIFENISGLDDTTQHVLYNTMLLDPRWYKWMLQSGVKRHATPRYWQIGQLHQDKYPGATVNVPEINIVNPTLWTTTGTDNIKMATTQSGDSDPTLRQEIVEGSSHYGLFQTGHRGVLGWLPTDGLQFVTGVGNVPQIASPPEVEVMKIILPKAYKTRYYYRMFITETVYFREPIVNFGIEYYPGGAVGTLGTLRPLDVFHRPVGNIPSLPTNPGASTGQEELLDQNTGGNFGDN